MVTLSSIPWTVAPVGQSGPNYRPHPSPVLGSVLVVIGVPILLAGIFRARANLRDLRERRRASKLFGRARALDAATKAGDVVWISGRVVGGHESGDEEHGVPIYHEHLLVDDEQGRSVCVGVPGRNEVRELIGIMIGTHG